ncbi:MAG: transglycosylase SLT domain-containing protein [Deltaproteobacteria bacterium]|nr:transglycosylase SLT domain-containing protein [Deltaproteobacteria bacterium]
MNATTQRSLLVLAVVQIGGALFTTRSAHAEPTAAGADALLVMSRVEGLLRLGHPEAAAKLAREVSDADPHAAAVRPLLAWALFTAADYAGLERLLGADGSLPAEMRYLRGAGLWQSGNRDAGLSLLRELWWGAPEGVWGQAALREMAVAGPKSPYRPAEIEQIRRAVPAVGFDTGRSAEIVPRAPLEAMRRVQGAGLLAAEVQHALGVSLLHDEKFSEAVAALSTALTRTRDRAFKRIIELHLGEAEHRRGAYSAAERHFVRVAAGPADRFAHEALAAYGRMAIEFRRYPQARALFEAQLVKNPVGEARAEALWGLGWVAFRTGDFKAARRFYLALFAEAPYGPLASRALYWGARAAEEHGLVAQAQVEMALIETRFPVDYYAYRARSWRKEAPLPPLVEEAAAADRRVAQVQALYDSGLLARGKKAIRALRRDWVTFGPRDLKTLEGLATLSAETELATGIRQVRQRRFPEEQAAMRVIARMFPASYVDILKTEAARQRIDRDLPAAVALQESGFNPRAVSPVGALGLMQIMPETARSLAREDSRAAANHSDILNPALNARLGVRYLGRMLRAFDRRTEYALAAYNAGPGAVTRWRESSGDLPVDIFVEEIPYAETRDYVRRVLAGLQSYRFVADAKVAMNDGKATTAELARANLPTP